MFKADLFIFGQRFPLLSFEVTLEKDDDPTGLPITNSYGGKMTMSYSSTKKDIDIIEAAMASRMFVDGYVRIYRRDGIQKFFDYEFANAYILFFNEIFDATNKNPVRSKIIVAPGILKRDSFIFENYWNPSNPFLSAAAPISSTDNEEEVEGEILDFFTTDKSGKRIDKFNIGDVIYVNIKSENKIGDEIEINLKDKTKDFKFKGEVLENDSMLYQINGNHDKIELEVIAES